MGIFERVFNKKSKAKKVEQTAIIREHNGTFSTWSGDAWANDVYRAGVDAIARNGAKLKGCHVIKYADHTKMTGECKMNRMLQVRPNPFMSAYDFLYKMISRMYNNNNSFALIDRDERGNVCGFYPITETYTEMLSDTAGNLYCRFTLNNGKFATFSYADIIHLRRNFSNNELMGDDNGALAPAIELATTQNDGIINSIKAGATIRGILHFTQILAPAKLKEEKEQFIADYLEMSNDGGVIATDQKAEYTPIDSKPVILSAEQADAIQNKIYNYLGVSRAIVNSDYTEDQFTAFYESVIEPIAIALSLEFTAKIFNEREQAFGNAILFDSGRMQYTSNRTKIDLIEKLVPFGVLSINQALEILNLPPVENGDRRLQSLNYSAVDMVDEYQKNKSKSEVAQ